MTLRVQDRGPRWRRVDNFQFEAPLKLELSGGIGCSVSLLIYLVEHANQSGGFVFEVHSTQNSPSLPSGPLSHFTLNWNLFSLHHICSSLREFAQKFSDLTRR